MRISDWSSDVCSSDLAGDRIDRIVTALGGQIERHRQAGLPAFEQELVPGVRFLGGSEPRILAHRPGPAGIAIGEDAPRERPLAGFAFPSGPVMPGAGAPIGRASFRERVCQYV